AATATDQVLLGAAHLHVARTGALLLAGRLGPAWSAADEGYRRAAEVGEPGLVASWAGLRGVIGQVRGDLVAAASALREAVALGERSDPVGLCGYHLAVLAGVLAQSGELDRAGAALAAADAAAPPVHPLYLPQIELNRARLRAAHAAMAASRAYGRAGRHRDATRTRDLALTLDLRCRGTGAPWRAVGDATALTPREHEIARLAAGRVSSGDIALRLSLSVRTVNNHLHRAYVKPGIS